MENLLCVCHIMSTVSLYSTWMNWIVSVTTLPPCIVLPTCLDRQWIVLVTGKKSIDWRKAISNFVVVQFPPVSSVHGAAVRQWRRFDRLRIRTLASFQSTRPVYCVLKSQLHQPSHECSFFAWPYHQLTKLTFVFSKDTQHVERPFHPRCRLSLPVVR
jgi:hypothetical protein